MTDKHDFKAALEEIEKFEWTTDKSLYHFLEDHNNALKTALRLADRLQSGEVSKKMYEAGCDCDNYVGDYIDGIDIERADCKEHWQAMAGQMMMEESE